MAEILETPNPDDWVDWTCPKCRYDNNDPYKVKETCCSQCGCIVTLGEVMRVMSVDPANINYEPWHIEREVTHINWKRKRRRKPLLDKK